MAAERKHIDSATKATKMGYGMEDGRMKYRMNREEIGNRNRLVNLAGRNRQ
jgi:hypothetical protein